MSNTIQYPRWVDGNSEEYKTVSDAIVDGTAMCNGAQSDWEKEMRYELWQYNNVIYAVVVARGGGVICIEEIRPEDMAQYVSDAPEYA